MNLPPNGPVVLAAVPFIHPGLAVAGAALAGLPLLIHLLNRRRYKRVAWAAMEFLLAASRREARRLRFEQWLLLAARTAIMVLIALALARPLLRPSPLAEVLGRASVHRVILLDNSQSMAMPSGTGRTAFEHAHALARSLIDSFNPSDGVSLITVGSPSQTILERPVYDRRLVHDELARIHQSHRGTDLLGGLSLATEILEASEAPAGNRAVYLLTDNPESAWQGTNPQASIEGSGVVAAARRLAELAKLHVVVVGKADRPNLAVTDLAPKTRLLGTDELATFTVRVENHSRDRTTPLTLDVRADGRRVRTIDVGVVDPAETAEVPLTLSFAEPGSHRLEVVLSGSRSDVIEEDNTRFLSVQVRHQVPVLLVDGKPALTRFDGQTGYLATALAPRIDAADRTLMQIKSIVDGELAGEPFDAYALIALCNVRRLDSALWSRLETYLHEGGGLLVFLGDQVDLDHYNRLGFADGAGLLPARLDRLVEAAPNSDPFRFDPQVYTHPVLSDFAEAPRGGLLLTSIHRYVRADVPREQPGVDVILTYNSGDPAMIEKAIGQGRLVLVTTTANMDWTNFPARGGYVPVVQNLAHYLAPTDQTRRNLLVGGTLIEPLTARQSSLSLSLTQPDGTMARPRLRPDRGGFQAIFEPVEQPGIHELTAGGQSVFFSANLEPSESHMAEMDTARLRELLADRVEIWVRPDTLEQGQSAMAAHDLGPRLLGVVLGLLLIESALALWFGRGRTTQS